MKILITGGFGYLGGRLAQHLSSREGNEVFLGSRVETDPPFWLPEAQVVKTNWQSKKELEDICIGMDAVVHLSGMNAQDCVADFVGALEVNGVFTARLLHASINQGVSRFIYLSTAHVYSNNLTGVITEKNCPASSHPYAASHRAGEDVVLSQHKKGNIEGVVIRLSNAFGMPAHKDVNCWMLLVNDLCSQVATTQSMRLRSSGEQRRDFITLTDASRAVEHILKIPVIQLGDGLFNVGGKWSPTILEMAQLISERAYVVMGNRPKISREEKQMSHVATVEKLDYRIDKLINTKFGINCDVDQEIDQLLQFLIKQETDRL
jgi:UDP-glucose 4-epimerase